MDVNKGELSDHWGSIAKLIRRAITQYEKLPDYERDEDFRNDLWRAYNHADSREDALIDPS